MRSQHPRTLHVSSGSQGRGATRRRGPVTPRIDQTCRKASLARSERLAFAPCHRVRVGARGAWPQAARARRTLDAWLTLPYTLPTHASACALGSRPLYSRILYGTRQGCAGDGQGADEARMRWRSTPGLQHACTARASRHDALRCIVHRAINLKMASVVVFFRIPQERNRVPRPTDPRSRSARARQYPLRSRIGHDNQSNHDTARRTARCQSSSRHVT